MRDLLAATPLLPPSKVEAFKWAGDANSTTTCVPSTHILSDHKRPHLAHLTPAYIPVVDLSDPEDTIKAKIAKASQECGIFYLINHGVDEGLCNDVLDAVVDFFNLPVEQERALLHTRDFNKDVKVVTYAESDDERNVPGWSEAFTHLWHPCHDSFLDPLPSNPPQYRELIRRYSKEMGKLVGNVLGWMSEGLGLDKEALDKSMGEKPKYYKMQSNYYPPCPDPELTLGLPVHNDMAALAVIRQSEHVTGLHILKDDGKWAPVPPLPNAFVCNVGDVMEVLSNGRYKSVRHRAVTSKDKSRVSVVAFVAPNKETMLGPMKEMVDEEHPPRYETFAYGNFHEIYLRPWLHPDPDPDSKLNNPLNP